MSKLSMLVHMTRVTWDGCGKSTSTIILSSYLARRPRGCSKTLSFLLEPKVAPLLLLTVQYSTVDNKACHCVHILDRARTLILFFHDSMVFFIPIIKTLHW